MNKEHNQSQINMHTKENNINNENTEEKFSLAREILEMIVYFIVLVIIFLLLQTFVGQHVEVNGKSMENNLFNGDHIILEKVSYRFNEPSRFDIVVFRPYETEEEKNNHYIKRVIGLPGEIVSIYDGQVYVNGEMLQENYGNEAIINAGIANNEVLLKDDEYFLLGDNRNNSVDSRSSYIGPVERNQIIGRAWVRIWPINSIEILDH